MKVKVVYNEGGDCFGVVTLRTDGPGPFNGKLHHVCVDADAYPKHGHGWRDDGGCEPDGGPGPRPLTLEWRKRVAAWLREVGPSLPEVPCWHPGVERDPAARPSLAEADFPA